MDSEYINNPALVRGYQLLKEKFENDKDLLATAYKSALHDEIFEALQLSGILPYIVFQGDTCLQRVYNLPRLSEDLDFCYADFTDTEKFLVVRQNLEASLKEVLQTRLGFPPEYIQVSAPADFIDGQALGNKVEKWKTKIIVSARGQKQALHVEIANVPSLDYKKEFIPSVVQNGTPRFGNVETTKELFNDKAIALCFRPYIKHRDLYDIFFLAGNRQQLDADMFLQKMKAYHIDDPLSIIKEKLQALQYTPEAKAAFLAELGRFVSKKNLDYMEKTTDDYFYIGNKICSECLAVVEEALAGKQTAQSVQKKSPCKMK